MKLLAWDIEMRPLEAYRWGLFDKNPVALTQMIRPGGMISFAARWVDEPKRNIIYRDVQGSTEAEVVQARGEMLGTLYSLMEEADGLISWNGKRFDTLKANAEFVQLGWPEPAPSAEVDLMLAFKKKIDFPSNKLEYVANVLLGKGKAHHEGFLLWVKCMQGDPKAWARMQKYNKQDVHLLVDLYYKLLPWIDTIPNQNLFDGYDSCTRCGSDHVQRRGYRYTRVSKFARYQCQDCGGWMSSGKAEERVDIR